jgi:hypothetical protein
VLLGQVKVKSEIAARKADLEKLKASLKNRKESDMATLPQFSHSESLLAILQLMQERSNMLEQMVERYLLQGQNSMANLYFERMKEVHAHADNLKEILSQYSLKIAQ